MIYDEDPLRRSRRNRRQVKTTGGVWLNGEKNDRMGFWTPPTDENRAIRKVEAEDLSNDGAIWVTSPWKSYHHTTSRGSYIFLQPTDSMILAV